MVRFLLVRTKGGKYWTFPKGGFKTREQPWQGAEREAREEAGAIGTIEHSPFTEFEYRAVGEKVRTVPAFLMEVANPDNLKTHEPGRKPKWFEEADAIAALEEDRDAIESDSMVEALTLAARTLD
ncbi:MAG: NUDIX domain-containing protein [Acidobacteria bacterium]|nr:NUDIX domain-containing protein [Acidobacteriota bacterium]